MRFTFNTTDTPYILLESSRPSVVAHTPTNISFPLGTVSLSLLPNSSLVHEICGSNDERQDTIITPTSSKPHAANFKGYYCARFDYTQDVHRDQSDVQPYGIIQNSTAHPGMLSGTGPLLLGYTLLTPVNGKTVVSIRVGTSFISIDQARRNIDAEAPDATSPGSQSKGPQTLEETARLTRAAWTEKLDIFAIEGATEVQKDVFWTGVAHALQVSNVFSSATGASHETLVTIVPVGAT